MLKKFWEVNSDSDSVNGLSAFAVSAGDGRLVDSKVGDGGAGGDETVDVLVVYPYCL